MTTFDDNRVEERGHNIVLCLKTKHLGHSQDAVYLCIVGIACLQHHYDGPEWPVSQVTENDFVAKVKKNACFNRTVQIFGVEPFSSDESTVI